MTYTPIPSGGPAGWSPVPEPGVIPLRPLGLGDILGGAFRTMGRYWKQLFGPVVAVYIAAGFLSAAVFVPVVLPRGGHDPGGALLASATVFVVVILLLATAMVYTICPVILQDAVLGRKSRIGDIRRRSMRRFPAMVGTLLLMVLIFAIPGGLLLALALSADSGGSGLPGVLLVTLLTVPVLVFLWVRLSLAPTITVFEGQGPVESLRRSWRLVRDAWWRVFGISLLVSVIAWVASYAVQVPFALLAFMPVLVMAGDLGPDPALPEMLAVLGVAIAVYVVGQLLSQLILTVLPALTAGLLYVDRRIRDEDLAPALVQASAPPAWSPPAGLPPLAPPPRDTAPPAPEG
ncbi:hypothetical protein [Streptomyces sp. CAU 1734]|uniref:hypothetical protein n=1 Tax=Streptomyces sp. CAU 1734 TaxID=3140360 RepID=UPI0032613C73